MKNLGVPQKALLYWETGNFFIFAITTKLRWWKLSFLSKNIESNNPGKTKTQ